MIRAKRKREEDVLATDAVNPALVLLPISAISATGNDWLRRQKVVEPM